MVERAFDGADTVFWVAPPTPSQTLDDTYVNLTRPAADAIRSRSVGRVVVVTALGRGGAWQERAGLVTAYPHGRPVKRNRRRGPQTAMPGFMEKAL